MDGYVWIIAENNKIIFDFIATNIICCRGTVLRAQLDKIYVKNEVFKTINSYIDTIEYLGMIFNIDDSQIYTIDKFNSILKKKMNNYNQNNSLVNSRERVIYIYNCLNSKKITPGINKILNKEYKAAYYLYLNM